MFLQLVGDWYETHATSGDLDCIHVVVGLLEDNSTLTWHYHWKNATNPNQPVVGMIGHAKPGATSNTFEIFSFHEQGQSELKLKLILFSPEK